MHTRRLPRWKLVFFRGITAPKPYNPQQNSCTKGTSLGCRLAPKWLRSPGIVPFQLVSAEAHRSTVPYFGLFLRCTEIRKFFTGVRMRKAIHACCFKNGQNRSRIKWPKGCIALITKKNKTTFWHPGAEPLGWFLHFSCVSAHRGTSLTFQIIFQISST